MIAFLAIVLIYLSFGSAEHDTFTKNYRFPNKELIVSEASLNNATLFYASCDQSPKHCTIVHETNPFVKSAITAKCNVDLQADNVELLIGSRKHKAILITLSNSMMLQATIVNMSSCKSAEVDIVKVPSDWTGVPLHHEHLDVVVFEKSFDVVIKGLQDGCAHESGKKVYCSFTFDYEGKKIEGPTVWPKMSYDEMDIVSPILPAVSGEWYFFVRREDSLSALLVDRHGGTSSLFVPPIKIFVLLFHLRLACDFQDPSTRGCTKCQRIIWMCGRKDTRPPITHTACVTIS